MIRNTSLDPRTKLFIVMCMSSMSVVVRDIKLLSLIGIISLIMSLVLKSPLFIVISKMKKFLCVFIGMVIIQSIFTNAGKGILVIWHVTILTDFGMIKSIEFVLRITIVLISASILMTSSSREILQGLIKIRIPYEIAFMVMIGIKFLPLFTEELRDNLTAIELRGIDIKSLPLRKKIRLYTYIFTPVVVGAVIKSKKIAIAMECKGLRAFNYRTSFMKLRLKWVDYMMVGINCIITITILGKYYIG